MAKRIKAKTLPEFDPSLYLNTDEAIATYLADVMQANNTGLLAAAIGDVAKVRAMADIAIAAGLSREALYKAFQSDGALQFDTLNRVCMAMGLRLVAQAQGGAPSSLNDT